MSYYQDTIAAIATASGHGSVGIVRVSGPDALSIAATLTDTQLKPRYAHYLPFTDGQNTPLDEGVALYFKAPHSFTGEDIVEFQAHGGPIVLDLLLKACVDCGARLAEPGEFTKRAFLNDKMDLAQAEAIADLIEASSEQAARCAMRSLQGEFSHAIDTLVNAVIELRMFVEAAIDFPEEETDFLADAQIMNRYQQITEQLAHVFAASRQGALLREGINIVIAGRPNAGKSSLLNALAGKECAIVTEVAGTTRDVLKESVQLDGVPVHLVDTAGIRDSDCVVESEGIKRAQRASAEADHMLLVCDINTCQSLDRDTLFAELFPDSAAVSHIPVTWVMNKVDLLDQDPDTLPRADDMFYVSARSQQGIETLKQHLLHAVGYRRQSEGIYTARTRHLKALEHARTHIHQARIHIDTHCGELLAEELRLAQEALAEITGSFTADDLLGEIFSSFCIGK